MARMGVSKTLDESSILSRPAIQEIFMIKFIKESREELRNVVWPSREEVLNSTVVVLGAVVLASMFLYGIDNLFEMIFNALVELGS